MKIALCTSKLNFKDAGGSVHDFDLKVRLLRKLGVDAVAVTFHGLGNKEMHGAYPVVETQVETKTFFHTQRDVYRFLKAHENEYSLFYVEGQFAPGAGLYRLMGGKRPVLVFCNVELSPWIDLGLADPKTSIVRKLFLHFRLLIEKLMHYTLSNRVDYAVFTAPGVKEKFESLWFFPKRSDFLPDLVSEEHAKQLADEGRAEAQVLVASVARPAIFTTGRFIPEKGFDVFLKGVKASSTNGTFLISGDGPERANLEKMADELGVRDRVRFLGWLPRATAMGLMRECDLMVVPRWRKHLTSVLLLEAMSLGAATVVPGGGTMAWLQNGAGTTFTFDDGEDLGKAIDKMTTAPERIAKAKIDARKTFEEKWAAEGLAKNMWGIMQELLQK